MYVFAEKFVETLRQQNASVSVDELCVLLASQVNKHAAQRMYMYLYTTVTH